MGWKHANSLWLAACRGGHPRAIGTCKLYVADCLLGLGGGGGARPIFAKNVGALKVVVVLVNLFTAWTFFGLSCVTGLAAEMAPHTMPICVFCRVYSFHGGLLVCRWVGEDWQSSPSGPRGGRSDWDSVKKAPKKAPQTNQGSMPRRAPEKNQKGDRPRGQPPPPTTRAATPPREGKRRKMKSISYNVGNTTQ